MNLPLSDFRPNVCAIILSEREPTQIYVFRRTGVQDAWQFPQGGIDPGETPEEALFRELKEEIGTNRLEILRRKPDPVSYLFPPGFQIDSKKGQSQIYFLCRFCPGALEEVRFDAPEEAAPPEFEEMSLMLPSKFLEYVIPFKRDAYRQALEWAGLIEAKH